MEFASGHLESRPITGNRGLGVGVGRIVFDDEKVARNWEGSQIMLPSTKNFMSVDIMGVPSFF